MSHTLDDIKEYVAKDLYNYTAPEISIVNLTSYTLELEHESVGIGTLDMKHTKKVMEYLYKVWNTAINLETVDDGGKVLHITLDEEGFSL